jgi:trehalose/maltose transport system substrate-binding protein
MKPWLSLALGGLLGAAALTAIAGPAAAQGATVSISCGAVGQELEVCRQGAEAWAQETGNTVTVVSTPNSSTERLALYQQHLAAGAADIDVFQIDVIWPGILGEHFIDLSEYMDGAEAEHFAAIVDRSGLVDLNRFRAFSKWLSASVTPLPRQAPAG